MVFVVKEQVWRVVIFRLVLKASLVIDLQYAVVFDTSRQNLAQLFLWKKEFAIAAIHQFRARHQRLKVQGFEIV
jgi:hypothetical protein